MAGKLSKPPRAEAAKAAFKDAKVRWWMQLQEVSVLWTLLYLLASGSLLGRRS